MPHLSLLGLSDNSGVRVSWEEPRFQRRSQVFRGGATHSEVEPRIQRRSQAFRGGDTLSEEEPGFQRRSSEGRYTEFDGGVQP